MEAVKDKIVCALPNLEEEMVNQLLKVLEEIGVECINDLSFVVEQDLLSVLKPIQARKLIASIKIDATVSYSQCDSSVSSSVTVIDLPISVPSSVTVKDVPINVSGSVTVNDRPIPSIAYKPTKIFELSHEGPFKNFAVDVTYLHRSLREDLEAGRRLSPGLRREFVRIIVDQMQQIDESPTKSSCVTVAKDIINRFHNSFVDTAGGEDVRCIHISLAKQLKSRIENVLRSRPFVRRRAKKVLLEDTSEIQQLSMSYSHCDTSVSSSVTVIDLPKHLPSSATVSDVPINVPSSITANDGHIPSFAHIPTTTSEVSRGASFKNFAINVAYLPRLLRKDLEAGWRPSPAFRRELVRILVDQMQQIDENPTKANCVTVVRDIINRFPKSLRTLPGVNTLAAYIFLWPNS